MFTGFALLAQTPIQNCTVTNVRGTPLSGTFCGGAFVSETCSPGVLYNCKSGVAGSKNNCTAAQVCPTGCTQAGTSGRCFAGATSFTVAPLNTPGGADVNLTTNLSVPHTGAIINLRVDRGDLIPGAFCAVPPLANNQTTANYALSTAVVPATTPVQLYTDIAYGDASGNSVELISRPQIVTLQPGGTEPPTPPISTFVLDPTSIAAGGIGFARVSLAQKAPASGVQIAMTSSDPSVASIIAAGQPFVQGSCTDGSVAESIQGAQSVAQTTTVNISASSGAAGQAPLVQPLTVTNGCVPLSCSGGPTCGPQSNGCGGTMNCGCADANQTCGGGGTANVCGTPVVSVSSLTMNPTTLVGGASSTGTVTLNPPAPMGGAVVALSSNSSFASVPASITIPSGGNVGSFTATTTPVQSGTVAATISATLNTTSSATLNLTATAQCVPTTCAAQGKTCGTISNGCGGTLTCGSACTGTAANITVTANGKGGKVTSSPSGINVSSGNSQTASFAAGTPITLTTDDGHGAIWSGLCSSSGAAVTTCTFTAGVSGTVVSSQQ
jgi:hypothetical protein